MNKSGMYFILFFLVVITTNSGYTQTNVINYWNTLSDVTFVTKQVDGYEIDLPKFGSNVMALNGKRITLKGYLIPFAESGSTSKYMLSSMPFSSCFFCGAAGPETVIELLLKQKVKFSENAIVVEGVLILNDKDIDRHMYILKDASIKN